LGESISIRPQLKQPSFTIHQYGQPRTKAPDKNFQEFFKKEGLILDGGCGEGEWCYSLEKQGYRTIGIDIVPGAIQQAHRIGRQNGAESAFLIGDVTWLPFRENVLGGYISLGVVEHFRLREEVTRALTDAKRSLTPGGRAFFALPGLLACLRNSLSLLVTGDKVGMYHKYISKSSMERRLRSADLRVLISRHEKGWLGLSNIVDGIIKKLGNNRLRERLIIFWSNQRPVLFLSGNYFWTEKVFD